jgi:hypothetical protein
MFAMNSPMRYSRQHLFGFDGLTILHARRRHRVRLHDFDITEERLHIHFVPTSPAAGPGAWGGF